MKDFLKIVLVFMIWIDCNLFYGNGHLTFQEKSLASQKNLFVPLESPYIKHSSFEPTVFVAIFVRNKEYALPYFLNMLYQQNYPKKRMSVWLVTDHNSDNSSIILRKWVGIVSKEYHQISLEEPKFNSFYKNQQTNMDWTEERYVRLLKLRQSALDKARDVWADYIFFIDADNLLINPHTIWQLISTDKIVVAPALNTLSSYSNFWCGQSKEGYYVRTDDYFPIKNREILGTFKVPMVHSTFLIDLNKKKSNDILFWPIRKEYVLAIDDIIVFSVNAKAKDVELYVDNRYVYGFLPVPLQPHQTLIDDIDTFIHLLMEIMTEPPVGIGIEVKPFELLKITPEKSKLIFNEIYMINLIRRNDRFSRMKKVLDLQGINFKHFEAIDSKNLNSTYLKKMGIDMLPGFTDPYHPRTLTRGEIGCFLSHYFIWQEVVEKNYKQVVVLEDDVRFERHFNRKLEMLMNQVDEINLEWDLIYIGRKRMQLKEPEREVENANLLVKADYSFWTLGYLLSQSGASKLLAGKPLGKMVPVDEYLPIMFNKHPIKTYMDSYPVRNLNAFSAEPLLVYPTHYTGQQNYFSDTETSSIWEEVNNNGIKIEL